MRKILYLDMDGTIADLYNEKDWLHKILTETPNLFRNLRPIYNIEELQETFNLLIENGWDIQVITWTPLNTTERYNKIVAEEKKCWIQEHLPMITEVHAIPYGVPKQKAIQKKAKIEILADDNQDVLKEWQTPIRRQTIDARRNLLQEIRKLI